MPRDSRPGNGTIASWRPRGAGWACTLAAASLVACASDGNDEAHDASNAGPGTNVSVTTTSSNATNTTATTGGLVNGTSVTSTSAEATTSSSETETGSGGATTLSSSVSGSTTEGGGGTAGSGGELVVPPEGSYDFGSMPTSASSRDASLAYKSFKESHVEACGDGLYRVRWDEPALSVSEGIAYGMLLAVSNDDREVFDGLLQYYDNNLDPNGLMHWRREGCQGANPGDNSDNAATDADLDAAMALVMAECRWGDTEYGERADAVASALLQHGTSSADGVNLLHPGDVFGGTDCLNASYFAPAYYRVFAERAASDADAAFWTQLAADSYLLINRMANTSTGFVPNWSDDQGATTETGPPGCNWYNDAHIFGSDAIRTPWRIAIDYLWWGTPEAKQWLDRVTETVKSMGITSVGRKFQLDGAAFGEVDHSIISVGAFASAAMAYDQATADEFGAEAVAVSDHNYFPDSLRGLYLLTLAGRFTTCGGT